MTLRVLIIEDHGISAQLVQQVVETAGYQAVVASTLIQARHLFESEVPECFLCAIADYHLPDALHGEAVQFCLDSYLPTIVLTSNDNNEVRQRTVNMSIVDYFVKGSLQVYDYIGRLLNRLEKNRDIGVLVVNQRRSARNQICALLKRHNFDTYDAGTTERAAALLQEQVHIKLMICDNQLPGESGISLVEQLRQRYSKDRLAILAISAQGDHALSAAFIKSGASDYLTEPYSDEEFFCRVQKNVEHLESIQALSMAAHSDWLTGLPNRRYFFTQVTQYTRCEAHSFCVALADIDFFKHINDQYGHDAGDLALKAVSGVIKHHFGNDLIARFGGEEFCILMPATTLEQGVARCEVFREAVQALGIRYRDQLLHCTVSLGITDQYQGDIDDMINGADQLLYRAKQSGRNCVNY